MFWKKSPSASPGQYDREQAAKCRAAAKLARDEGDEDHAKSLEASADLYERDAVNAVRADREKRAGATTYSHSW